MTRSQFDNLPRGHKVFRSDGDNLDSCLEGVKIYLFTDEMLTLDYLRWLYTAFTRASERLYLVNLARQFLPDLTIF